MAINLVTKFSTKVLERLNAKSVTEGYFNSGYESEFIGAKTVKIQSIATAPMGDYTREGVNRYGTPTELQDTVQELTIARDRSFTYTIDKGNNLQQNMIKNAGVSLQRQIDEVVIPELETYRFAQTHAKVPAGNKVVVDVSADSIYEKFLDAQEKLDDANVPVAGRVAWATPQAIKEFKKDPNFVPVSDLAFEFKRTGLVGQIDGVDVVKAPKAWLPANVLMIIAHPMALCSPFQLNEYKVHEDPVGISGHLVEGRMIYDSFVIGGREVALAELVTA